MISWLAKLRHHEYPGGNVRHHPIHPALQPLPRHRRAAEYSPVAPRDVFPVQIQHLGDLLHAEGAAQVLLIGEDQETGSG